MKITRYEAKSVSRLEPNSRYRYFIRRFAASQLMYTLVDPQGSWALTDVEGRTVFSIWSATEFASACATGNWTEFPVKEISMQEFEDEIVDELFHNNLINVFPVKGMPGVVIEVSEFGCDFSEELRRHQYAIWAM